MVAMPEARQAMRDGSHAKELEASLAPTFHTILTVQSPGNEPVEIPYYTGQDSLRAYVAAGQALDPGYNNSPIQLRILSVRVDVSYPTNQEG